MCLHFLTSLGEINAVLCAVVIMAEEITFEHDKNA